MRKIIEEHLESFREKDLKRYSRIVNRYFKRKFRFVFAFFWFPVAFKMQLIRKNLRKFQNLCQFDFMTN